MFFKRNHVSVWNWIQKHHPQKISSKRRIAEFIVDETIINVGSEYVWLWVAIEPKNKADSRTNRVPGEKHVCCRKVYRRFGQDSWKTCGINRRWNLVSASMQVPKGGPSYPFIFEKSLIERTMQYMKDRTEGFDDYFPCKIKKCKLKHVMNWLHLFVDYHNGELNTLK